MPAFDTALSCGHHDRDSAHSLVSRKARELICANVYVHGRFPKTAKIYPPSNRHSSDPCVTATRSAIEILAFAMSLGAISMMKIRFAIMACVGMSAFVAAPAVAQTGDWSGLYVGGSIGQADVDNNDGETLVFDTNRDGNFNDTVNTAAPANAFSPGFCGGAANGNNPAAGCASPGSEIGYAIRAGYDWQFGNFVFGVLGEISKADIGDAVSGFSTTPASYTFKRDLDYAIAARLRGGYAFDNLRVYATGGYAQAELDRTFST
ncbi:MAG: outer membrane beta-barrel protein, partial [Hyphomonadaceae bacterium]